jgi:hypothetical protein
MCRMTCVGWHDGTLVLDEKINGDTISVFFITHVPFMIKMKTQGQKIKFVNHMGAISYLTLKIK